MEPPKKIKKLNETLAELPNTSIEPEFTQFCLELPPTFQPTGISYNQGDGKTILIITGLNEILTFLLGDLKTTISSPSPIEPLKKNVIETESEVIKVVHSKVRTYCLHKNKTLSLFTSHKQLKRQKSPVECYDIMKYKNGVVVLVKEPHKNVTIEHLPDIIVPGKPPKIIDCGPGIDDERYSLGCVVVTEQNASFLEKFLGVNMKYRIKKEPLLMFTVGNNIFWLDEIQSVTDEKVLETPDDSHDIKVVRSYSSKVMEFWMTKNMFVVVLVSGVMEVNYLCPLLNIVSCKRFYLFESCWSFNMERICVFSDGMNLNVIQLKQSKNEVEMQRKTIQLPGVVGLMYVKELNRMFCVTENRGIYQMSVTMEGKSRESRQFLMVIILKIFFFCQAVRKIFDHQKIIFFMKLINIEKNAIKIFSANFLLIFFLRLFC